MIGFMLGTRRMATIATAAVAALTLASCSSGGKSTASSASTHAAGGTSSAAAPVTAASSAAAPSSAGASTSSKPFDLSVTREQACSDAVTKEGGVLNYVAGTDDDQFKKEAVGFEKMYPNIKINFTSLQPQQAVQRVVAEEQAGHKLDIDTTYSDLPSAAPLLDKNDVLNVDWAKLGVPSDLLLTQDGVTVARTEREVLGLTYNTNLVKPSDLPNTWQDLINPKWAGKIITDPRGKYLSGLGIAWGQDKAVSWFKQFLSVDKPVLVNGATASMEKLGSGEALLGTSAHDSETAEQQANGLPVAIKYLDVVPTADYFAVIMKGAPHPEAAACWFAWFVSPQGQAPRFQYEFKKNVTDPPGLPAGAQLVPINTPAQAEVATATTNAFAKLMQ